jgi:hypothetical protein
LRVQGHQCVSQVFVIHRVGSGQHVS